VAGFSGNASAFTSVAADVTTNTTWTVAGSPYILEGVIFVRDGATLTIEPGVVVRGQPRTAAPTPGSIVGTPGALVVSRTGKINAVGTAASPIIMTTAAIDDNGDNIPDDCGGVLCTFTGTEAFYDDTPATKGIAPLNAAGGANVSLWGGVAILGNAPTNLANGFGVGQGSGIVEGLVIPGFPVAQATYGGADPHDDSGKMKFVSVRNAGDEIDNSNELNCITIAGVGDVTEMENIECQTNFDDGFEWFGGTVGGKNLVTAWIGDDAFDLDQGYSGILQSLLTIQTTFNTDSGGTFGSGSGDAAGEFDGEDSGEIGGVNLRPESLPTPTEFRPWPQSAVLIYNWTVLGTSGPGTNNATSAASANRGVRMRNGYAGDIWNSIITGTGTQDCFTVEASGSAGFTAADNAAAGLVTVGTTTCSGTNGIAGAAVTAADNGDAERCSRGPVPACTSAAGTPPTLFSENLIEGFWNTSGSPSAFAGLVQPESYVEPKAACASNKLDVCMTSAGAAIDPRPDPFGGPFGVSGAVAPAPAGTVDSAATYRGAFEPGAPAWTGFTSLSDAGVLVP
jgi:hypothetical protein